MASTNFRTAQPDLGLITVSEYGAKGDGVTNDTAALSNANSFASSYGLGLFFPPGTYVVDAIAFTVPVEFAPGAQLSVNSGQVVTMAGPVSAFPMQIFAGAGRVKLLKAYQPSNVMWWGLKGDGTTDDTAALQAAIDNTPDNATIEFPQAVSVSITSTIYLDNRINMTFIGGNRGGGHGNAMDHGNCTTIIWGGTSTGAAMFSHNQCMNPCFRGFWFQQTGPHGTALFAHDLNNSANGAAHNSGWTGSTGAYTQGNQFIGCQFSNNSNLAGVEMIRIGAGNAVNEELIECRDCTFDVNNAGTGGNGYAVSTYGDNQKNLRLIDCQIYNGAAFVNVNRGNIFASGLIGGGVVCGFILGTAGGQDENLIENSRFENLSQFAKAISTGFNLTVRNCAFGALTTPLTGNGWIDFTGGTKLLVENCTWQVSDPNLVAFYCNAGGGQQLVSRNNHFALEPTRPSYAQIGYHNFGGGFISEGDYQAWSASTAVNMGHRTGVNNGYWGSHTNGTPRRLIGVMDDLGLWGGVNGQFASTYGDTVDLADGQIQIQGLATPTGLQMKNVGAGPFTQQLILYIQAVDANGYRSLIGGGNSGIYANATLSNSNYVQMNWDPVPGAATYNVVQLNSGQYRLVASGIATNSYQLKANPTGAYSSTYFTGTVENSNVRYMCGQQYHMQVVSSNYTIVPSDHIILVDASGGPRTITLPADGPSNRIGREFVIIKNDSSGNAVTVANNGGSTINGGGNVTLSSQYSFISLIGSNNNNWTTVGQPAGVGPTGPQGPPGPVSSVGLSLPGEFTVSGSPVTSSGTLTGAWATQAANKVLAGPTSGGASTPTFRALVGADLPNPSSSTLGGVESYAAVSHQWINSISTSGAPSSTQPAVADLSDAKTGTGSIVLATSPTLTTPNIGTATAAALKPASDSTTALQLQTSGGTSVLDVDTTNSRIGIGTTSPSYSLVVGPNIASGFVNAAMTVSKGSSSSASIVVGATSSNLLEFGWDNGNTRGYTNTPLGTPMVWTQDGTNIRLAISSGGNVGIGLSGPTHQLQLSTDDAAKTSTTAWTTTSDVRTKEQIEDYTEGLETLLKLRPRQFVFNGKAGTPAGERGVGFVAQELEQVDPEMIRKTMEKLNPDDTELTGILKVNPHKLQFVLVNAIKELETRIKALEENPGEEKLEYQRITGSD